METRRIKSFLFTLGVALGGLLLGSPFLLETAQAQISDAVFVGAGDITNCSRTEDELTAQLLDGIAGTVFTTGDNAYPDGTLDQFNNCYGPTWGRHKDRTRPSPGNHDYHVAGAAGYYTYFGTAASPLDGNCTSNCRGYYSYNLGAWHIIALNSEIDHSVGSVQEQWLRADLIANQTACTLAYWHKPLFSSGQHGNNSGALPFFQALYDHRADVVLNGHDHTYERFAPQNPAGQADPARGIREFVVGTGGASLYPFPTVQPNSEVRNNTTWGVLKLTLHSTSYDWEFIPASGGTFTDSGSGSCVSAGPVPTASPTPSPNPMPSATPTPTPTTSPIPPATSTPTPTAIPADTSTPIPTASPVPPETSTTTPSAIPADTSTPTQPPTPVPSETLALTSTPSPVTATPTPVPTTSGGDTVYLSSSSGGSVGGLSFADEDILAYHQGSGTWSIVFDGSDVGLGNTDVDGFSLLADGSLLISIDSSTYTVSGLGTIEDRDIVRFIPTSLGNSTAGNFEWYFDGSDVGLTTGGEDVDALNVLSDGQLLISTRGSFGVTGASGADEDLFAFSPTSLGQNTAGTWSLYFDGSDVGLNSSSSEDVNAVWIDAGTGEIYLSTLGAFSVNGATGTGADIFICSPGTLGPTTSCNFRMYWTASNFGWGSEVTDGIQVARP